LTKQIKKHKIIFLNKFGRMTHELAVYEDNLQTSAPGHSLTGTEEVGTLRTGPEAVPGQAASLIEPQQVIHAAAKILPPMPREATAETGPRHRADNIGTFAAVRIGVGRTIAKYGMRGLRAGNKARHELHERTASLRQKLGERALHGYFVAQETLGKTAKEVANNKTTRNRTLGAAAIVGAGVVLTAYLMHNGLHGGGSGQSAHDLRHGGLGKNAPVLPKAPVTPHEHFELVKGHKIAPRQADSFTLQHGQTIWGRWQQRHPHMSESKTYQHVARILRFNHWTWADARHLPDSTTVNLPGKK
jgi:hypothetical protein